MLSFLSPSVHGFMVPGCWWGELVSLEAPGSLDRCWLVPSLLGVLLFLQNPLLSADVKESKVNLPRPSFFLGSVFEDPHYIMPAKLQSVLTGEFSCFGKFCTLYFYFCLALG